MLPGRLLKVYRGPLPLDSSVVTERYVGLELFERGQRFPIASLDVDDKTGDLVIQAVPQRTLTRVGATGYAVGVVLSGSLEDTVVVRMRIYGDTPDPTLATGTFVVASHRVCTPPSVAARRTLTKGKQRISGTSPDLDAHFGPVHLNVPPPGAGPAARAVVDILGDRTLDQAIWDALWGPTKA